MKKVSGMAILLILFFMAIISTLVLQRWFIRSWVDDVLISRKQWYTRFYEAEFVMDAALVWVKQNKEMIFEEKEPIVLHHPGQKATIRIVSIKNQRDVRIVQVTGTHNFCLSCLVTREGVGDGSKKGRVVVSCFTLGRVI
jgi:Fe-S cluster biogenesis protein NfuA